MRLDDIKTFIRSDDPFWPQLKWLIDGAPYSRTAVSGRQLDYLRLGIGLENTWTRTVDGVEVIEGDDIVRGRVFVFAFPATDLFPAGYAAMLSGDRS